MTAIHQGSNTSSDAVSSLVWEPASGLPVSANLELEGAAEKKIAKEKFALFTIT